MSRLGNWLETPGSTIDCEDDLEAVQSLFLARGWSDGLPVIPPTPERVEAMLAYCDRPWDEPFMTVPPRYAPATPARIAARLAEPERIVVIAGVNLPLLVRALTHRRGPLDEIAAELLDGVRESIVPITAPTDGDSA